MSSLSLGRAGVCRAGAVVMPAPKGWSTAKLRASTLKRLGRLQDAFTEDESRPSVDAAINLLIDDYYQKSIV